MSATLAWPVSFAGGHGASSTGKGGSVIRRRAGPKRVWVIHFTRPAACSTAEGSKARNSVVFANSDVEMMRFFWGFLRECFGVEAARASLRLNVYTGNGLTLEQIEEHWLAVLDLPRSSLLKPTVNHFPTSSSGKKKNKLPYGVCGLRVSRSTDIVQHIYGAIQEYAGFDEPRWLDGPERNPCRKMRSKSQE
jgi:hypothetical protein